MEFREGDKVKVIRPPIGCGNGVVGQHGVVTAIITKSQHPLVVDLAPCEETGLRYNVVFCQPADLKLLKHKSMMPKSA